MVISVFIFVLYMPLFKTTSRLSKTVFKRTWDPERHDCAVLLGCVYLDETSIKDKVELNDGNKI